MTRWRAMLGLRPSMIHWSILNVTGSRVPGGPETRCMPASTRPWLGVSWGSQSA
ncbi:hypothetical protein PF002_g16342 [Phytophthora fragariae]|uniref:Uncharacterized protein n=1 Tax=Phytophthora fragariae TaxID=53985 RepID=A0A6A3PGV6_9STRA|nr:hypothetical protein PF006_g32280 [Phytophthora fragariae]KAE9218957.1 hypothetical protein PF002_g16342 [Phytophthora fragariae]